jgi:hypothetical protein
MFHQAKRETFLASQGYSYKVVPDLTQPDGTSVFATFEDGIERRLLTLALAVEGGGEVEKAAKKAKGAKGEGVQVTVRRAVGEVSGGGGVSRAQFLRGRCPGLGTSCSCRRSGRGRGGCEYVR